MQMVRADALRILGYPFRNMALAIVGTMLRTVMIRRDHTRHQCSNAHVQSESLQVLRSDALRGCGFVQKSQASDFVERVASLGAHEYNGTCVAASVSERRVW